MLLFGMFLAFNISLPISYSQFFSFSTFANDRLLNQHFFSSFSLEFFSVFTFIEYTENDDNIVTDYYYLLCCYMLLQYSHEEDNFFWVAQKSFFYCFFVFSFLPEKSYRSDFSIKSISSRKKAWQ